MEINMENAFFFAVKYSLGPFASSLEVAANKIEKFMFKQVQHVLERPLRSTILVSWFILITILLTTIPLLVLTGVLCIVSLILIMEGFVLGVLIALTTIITASILSVTIITVGFISSYFSRTGFELSA